ncbi:MAG TPA: nicotinate (nicotinamide) nucleotide adenylyltransferase [Burkholderiales bacterium]|nr:nicotinate (nicotinamide) nucleotide adenylyltransferase [Burkholderiales bacterium]
MKVGVLGGTFDPVHNAHLAMARAALDHLGLDKILWIPTGAPHYRNAAIASAADRLAMLRLALDGEPRYVIDERELAPQSTGYTVDTLNALRRELGPEAELYLLIGADQYAKFREWRSPDEIERLAQLAVFPRPGFDVKSGKALRVPMPPMPHAATDIRRGEKAPGEQVPPAVANYIARKGLYR